VLATVTITGTATYGTDLSIVVRPDVGSGDQTAAVGSVNFLISGAALQSSAATTLEIFSQNSAKTSSTVTTAAFTGGTVSFNFANTATYNGTTVLNLSYSGSTQIAAAAAGSIVVSYGSGAGSVTAASSSSGSTATITRAGLNSEVNFASVGGSAFASYIRIHNSGASSGTATITLRDDTTGSQVGTTSYTTASVPGNGTIQVPIDTVEKALGVTANPAITYTATVSGQFIGYIQHVLYNATTGSYVNLSAFRQGSGTANP